MMVHPMFWKCYISMMNAMNLLEEFVMSRFVCMIEFYNSDLFCIISWGRIRVLHIRWAPGKCMWEDHHPNIVGRVRKWWTSCLFLWVSIKLGEVNHSAPRVVGQGFGEQSGSNFSKYRNMSFKTLFDASFKVLESWRAKLYYERIIWFIWCITLVLMYLWVWIIIYWYTMMSVEMT